MNGRLIIVMIVLVLSGAIYWYLSQDDGEQTSNVKKEIDFSDLGLPSIAGEKPDYVQLSGAIFTLESEIKDLEYEVERTCNEADQLIENTNKIEEASNVKSFTINTIPPGVMVWFNRKILGESPLVVHDLRIGDMYSVEIRDPNYLPHPQLLHLKPGMEEMTIELQPLPQGRKRAEVNKKLNSKKSQTRTRPVDANPYMHKKKRDGNINGLTL